MDRASLTSQPCRLHPDPYCPVQPHRGAQHAHLADCVAGGTGSTLHGEQQQQQGDEQPPRGERAQPLLEPPQCTGKFSITSIGNYSYSDFT